VGFFEYDDEHRCAEHEHDSGSLSLSATVMNRASPDRDGQSGQLMERISCSLTPIDTEYLMLDYWKGG